MVAGESGGRGFGMVSLGARSDAGGPWHRD
jgi:hypothetical protein